jgi:hypothetical protein
MPPRKKAGDLKLKQATLCVNPSSFFFAVPSNRSHSGGAHADSENTGSTSTPKTTPTQISSNENDTPPVSSRTSIEKHVSESDDEHEAFGSNNISTNNGDEDQGTPPPTSRNFRHLPRRKSLKVQSSPSDTDELEGPPRKRARIRRGKPSSAGISTDEDVAQLANEVDEDRMLILSLYITFHNLCTLPHRGPGFKVKNPSQNCVSEKFRKTKKYS